NDVFVKDLVSGTITRVSTGAGGQADGASSLPTSSVSADGRFVLFRSNASNLVAGTSPLSARLYVTDMLTGVAGGDAIHFTGSATDRSPADTAAGFTYSWTVSKNGSPGFASGVGAGFDFTPDENGLYDLTLTARDKDGGVGTATRTIAVAGVVLTATGNQAVA